MIALRSGEALAEIEPARGALCARLRLAGEEILYLDAETLRDPAKNVRGGIPVLFPIAGKLPPGSRFALRQHGFARTLPWEAVRCGPSRLECRLRTEARDDFPFPTDALLAFELAERALLLEFTLHNPGDEALPFQLGFHPYFAVADKARARLDTGATRAFDNLAGATGPLPQLDFTQAELDLHLLDHRQSGTVLHRPPGAPVRLRYSPEFRTLVLWTLGGRDFICVEPWTAPAGALASGAGILRLAPGERRTLSFEIAV